MSNTTSSLVKSGKTASPMEPFPFLSLPGEIRNQIYELLLCDVQEPEPLDGLDEPSAVTIAKRNLHPQLLRTCRQVYGEAKHVMLTKNRFVEVQFGGQGQYLNYGFSDLISLFRVPTLRIKRYTTPGDRVFGGCVMHHQTSSTGGPSTLMASKADSVLLLHRDLPKLLPAIMQSQSLVSINLNGTSIQKVTLLNAFAPRCTIIKEFEPSGTNSSGCELSVKVLQNNQRALLSPYSPSFQRESSFTVFDGTMENTGPLLIQSKKAVPTMTAESVLKDLNQLTGIGNNYRVRGIWGYASAFYRYVDYKISVLMSQHNPTIVRLLVEDGETLQNQIAELYFDVCYYRAKNAVDAMRQFQQSHREELEDLFDTVMNMGNPPEAHLFPDFTQSAIRYADHLYLEAVAWRLTSGGHSTFNMDMALVTVDSGLAIVPDHPELILEKRFLVREILEARLDFHTWVS